MRWLFSMLAFGSLLLVACGSQAQGRAPSDAAQPASVAATAVEATVTARMPAMAATAPTPVPAPNPTVTPVVGQAAVVTHTFAVTNTGGLGVILRKEPGGEEIRQWPEGTWLEISGYRQHTDGFWWALGKDPAGNEGWVRRDFLGAPPPSAPLSTNPNAVAQALPRGATLASAPGPDKTVTPAAPGGPRVYYQADWSQGLGQWTEMNGGPIGSCWRISSGMLVTDGTHCTTSAYAPFEPGKAGIVDYAVEADIQIVNWKEVDCFGITAHQDPSRPCVAYGTLQLLPQSGLLYSHAGILTADNLNYVVGTGPFVPLLPNASPVTVNPGEWHTYRLTVKGSHVEWAIDNHVFAESTESRKLAGGKAGLGMRCGAPRLAVRSFRIVEP